MHTSLRSDDSFCSARGFDFFSVSQKYFDTSQKLSLESMRLTFFWTSEDLGGDRKGHEIQFFDIGPFGSMHPLRFDDIFCIRNGPIFFFDGNAVS